VFFVVGKTLSHQFIRRAMIKMLFEETHSRKDEEVIFVIVTMS